MCFTLRSDGRSFSSGRSLPNLRDGGAVGLRIESKTGRSSRFVFLFRGTNEIIQSSVNKAIDKGCNFFQDLLEMSGLRRPFWMPASNYYVLAFAVAAAFFFVVWGILEDEGVKAPWQTAGVSACVLLCGAVIMREVFIRRAQNRFLRQPLPGKQTSTRENAANKLTAERAVAILKEIRRKSDAANVLDKISSGHREVYELCGAYIQRIEIELPSVKPGSPRLAALIKGRNAAAEMHKFHTMRWAEIESRAMTAEVGSRTDAAERIRAAQNALKVIDQALDAYPAETSLLQSRYLLSELALSIKVSHAVEEAEKAAFRGDYADARKLYRDALFYLGREDTQSIERERAAERILEAMEKLPN